MIKKSFFLVAAALTFAVAIACQPPKDKSDKGEAVTAAAGSYVCPMHADVVSDKPAQCSKCGMELDKKADGDHGNDHMHADTTTHE